MVIYDFAEYCPLFPREETVVDDDYVYIDTDEWGWPVPPPCPIDGTPFNACIEDIR